MKVLVFLTLAALVAAEAEPEADPLLVITSDKTIAAPITYTVPSALPWTGLRYTGLPLTLPINPLVTLAKPEEAAPIEGEVTTRAKREADPQLLLTTTTDGTIAPITYTVPSTLPLTGLPYAGAPWALPINPLVTVTKPEEAAPIEGEIATRAKREADPQLLLTTTTDGTIAPITYTVPSTLPLTGLPYAGAPWALPINPLVTVTKPEEAAPIEGEIAIRAKREADPQLLIDPLFPLKAEATGLPLTYNLPAITATTLPLTTIPYPTLPIAYTLAKKTE